MTKTSQVVRIAVLWVISYRLFGTTYRPHLQGSRIQRWFLTLEEGGILIPSRRKPEIMQSRIIFSFKEFRIACLESERA